VSDQPADRPPRIAAWVSVPRAQLLRRAVGAAGGRLAAVGTEERGRAPSLADELGCAALVDIRAALASVEADLFVFDSPGEFGAACDSGDARAVGDARARRLLMACVEPTPASAQDLLSAGWSRRSHGTAPIDGVRAAGLITRSDAFLEASTVLDAFGPVSGMAATALSTTDGDHPERSLGALLFDAVEAVIRLLGEPEQVTAAVRTAQRRRHQMPSLRIAGGEASALLRTPDGRTAQITASDRAGVTDTRLTLMGPAGSIELSQDTFTWHAPDGREIDRHRLSPQSAGESAKLGPWQRRIAGSIGRLLTDPAEGQLDWPAVLCTCDAILLAARTGATESPSTLRRAFGAGNFLFD